MNKRHKDNIGECNTDTYIRTGRNEFRRQWQQYIDYYSEDYNEDYPYEEIDRLLKYGFII